MEAGEWHWQKFKVSRLFLERLHVKMSDSLLIPSPLYTYASRNVIFGADISAVIVVVLWQPYKFFCFVFGCAPHTENVVIIPLPN